MLTRILERVGIAINSYVERCKHIVISVSELNVYLIEVYVIVLTCSNVDVNGENIVGKCVLIVFRIVIRDEIGNLVKLTVDRCFVKSEKKSLGTVTVRKSGCREIIASKVIKTEGRGLGIGVNAVNRGSNDALNVTACKKRYPLFGHKHIACLLSGIIAHLYFILCAL